MARQKGIIKLTGKVGDLSFYDISFKDYSLESVKAFGLSGKVVNTSKNTINYCFQKSRKGYLLR